jgi:hypothetical protein
MKPSLKNSGSMTRYVSGESSAKLDAEVACFNQPSKAREAE